MKWPDIKQQHPNRFILLGDLVEESISDTKSRILEGTVLKTSQDPNEIRQLYQQYKHKGLDVLYTLPSTPEELIVENVPFMSIIR